MYSCKIEQEASMRMTRNSAVITLVITSCLFLPFAVRAAQAASGDGYVQQGSGGDLSPEAKAKLEQKISKVLIGLPRYGMFDNVAFELNGRTVTLLGQVHDNSLKPAAEQAVRKIEGVENVVNNLTVLPPSPGDDRLRRAVSRAIYNYPGMVNYSPNGNNPPIHIIVENGHVTLVGIVNSEGDKNTAGIRAQSVRGVVSVTNNLRVMKG
jgi:hyperosmotically inducible protein